MQHTATRHGRRIILTPTRRGIAVATIHRRYGILNRGQIWSTDIRNQHTVWQAADHDGVWLDPICGDFVDAERALLDATAALDQPEPDPIHVAARAEADRRAMALIRRPTTR